jgi:protein-disulfide isomerase
MIRYNRRDLLVRATAVAGLLTIARPALAVDLAALNKAPEIGEMALGSESAKVTLIEYASATCPHCAAFHVETFGKLKTEYVDTDKVRFVFREFPLNDAALAAFMIARAAPKESYFPLIDAYFTTLDTWTAGNWVEGLFNIARQAGFSREKFDATLKDEALAKAILAIRDGGVSFGVKGTPTFFINGETFDGEATIEGLKGGIDPLLG